MSHAIDRLVIRDKPECGMDVALCTTDGAVIARCDTDYWGIKESEAHAHQLADAVNLQVSTANGLAVLIEAILRTGSESVIASELVAAAVGAQKEGDDELAHWLHSTVLRMRDRRKLLERSQQEREVALFASLPVSLDAVGS